jgi:hypothetical protein
VPHHSFPRILCRTREAPRRGIATLAYTARELACVVTMPPMLRQRILTAVRPVAGDHGTRGPRRLPHANFEDSVLPQALGRCAGDARRHHVPARHSPALNKALRLCTTPGPVSGLAARGALCACWAVLERDTLSCCIVLARWHLPCCRDCVARAPMIQSGLIRVRAVVRGVSTDELKRERELSLFG